MPNEATIKLTLEQRKLILQLLNYSYTIPVEYHKCVGDAIRKYATKTYSDETINNMVSKKQSIANSGFLIREDSLALFRGKFAEWLACIEYNALKNSGSVIMTIVNPDESSKADLLHFIKIGDEFKAVAGPDIKSGGSTYVFNQWKKIVTSRHDIPMVDFDNILTTEEGLKQLTKKQQIEFEELASEYPRKKPIPTMWTKQEELRLRTDYYKNILNVEGNFEYTPEITKLLKEALAKQDNYIVESDWTEFNKKCKEIFANANFTNRKEHIEDPTAESNSKKNNSKQSTNKTRNYKEHKPSNQGNMFKSAGEVVKKFGLAKIGGGLLVGGASIIGTVIAIKNPKLSKKVVSGAIKIFKNTGSQSSLIKAAKEVVKGVSNNEVLKEVVKGVSNNEVLKEVVKGVSNNKVLKEARNSPTLHEVSGYTKKNGKKVSPYFRGKS